MTEPFVDALATALAGGTASALGTAGKQALAKIRELIRGRFEQDPAMQEALEAAEQPGAGPEKITVLAQRLDQACADDPDFAESLHSQSAVLHNKISASGDGVVNVNQGSAERLIQARDIHGGITFN